MSTSRFPILLVEDNPDDIFFVRRAFNAAKLEHPLLTVQDGQEAIDYMSSQRQYAERGKYPLPRLAIADLKMPIVSGFELIKWMRNNPRARLIPIIVLSSSALPDDVNHAYALGANAYMVKPPDPRAFERLFRTIAEFWDLGEKPDFDWAANAGTERSRNP
jgi:CheY-like chemotaxis protein